MSYPLTKYQKTLCVVAAVAFVLWIVVAIVLNFVIDVGDKWYWTLGESVVFTVVLCLVLCFPAIEKKKSFSERIAKQYIDLRRDLAARLLLTENVFMFAMSIMHMCGLTEDGTVIAKVGVIHLAGMVMMMVCAGCVIDFAVKAKKLKLSDGQE